MAAENQVCALKFDARFPKGCCGAAASLSQVASSIAVHQDLGRWGRWILKGKIDDSTREPAQSFINEDANVR